MTTTINISDEDLALLNNIDTKPTKAVKFLALVYGSDIAMIKGEVQKGKNRLAFWKRILKKRIEEDAKVKNLSKKDTDFVLERVRSILRNNPKGNDFLWKFIEKHKPNTKLSEEIKDILKVFGIKR